MTLSLHQEEKVSYSGELKKVFPKGGKGVDVLLSPQELDLQTVGSSVTYFKSSTYLNLPFFYTEIKITGQ